MEVKERIKPTVEMGEGQIFLDFDGIIDITSDQLFELCGQNRELRIERTEEGKLAIMLPVGGEGSSKEMTIEGELYQWNKKTRLGIVFNSSGGFTLTNGAVRSPDAAFIVKTKWKALSILKRKKFAPICPDFVAELRSETDRLNALKEKMVEWMNNGCRLGWLIDPMEEKAYIYRPDQEVQIINSFREKLYGEAVLPGFELDLSELLNEDD